MTPVQIFNSTINVWDNESRGNYWSDYLTKYPNAIANLTSGTWNALYVIDVNNTDYHPLVAQVAVPEFPSYLILPLLLIATLAVVIIQKCKAFARPKEECAHQTLY